MDTIDTRHRSENYSDHIVHSVQVQSEARSLTRHEVINHGDQSLQISIDRVSETRLVVRAAASRLFRAYLPGLGFVESIQDTETEFRLHLQETESVDELYLMSDEEIQLLGR